jgi:hypothetical protein
MDAADQLVRTGLRERDDDPVARRLSIGRGVEPEIVDTHVVRARVVVHDRERFALLQGHGARREAATLLPGSAGRFGREAAEHCLFEVQGKTAEFDPIAKNAANLFRKWAE